MVLSLSIFLLLGENQLTVDPHLIKINGNLTQMQSHIEFDDSRSKLTLVFV